MSTLGNPFPKLEGPVVLRGLAERQAKAQQERVNRNALPPPSLTGERATPGTAATRQVLERPFRRTPDLAELRELHAYLRNHCWPCRSSYTQCIVTSRFLLHLYGGTLQGGWPDGFYAAADPFGSGYWFTGEWHHHCWLEQNRPGQPGTLIDLTVSQFREAGPPPDFTFTQIDSAVRYRPTHDLSSLASSVSYRLTRDRARRWVKRWTTIYGE